MSALGQRCQWYVEHGVQAALLVNPRDRSILLFRPGASPVSLRGAGRLDLSDIVPGLQFTAAALFASLRID